MTHSLPGATGGRVKAMGRFFPSRRAAAFTVWTFSYSSQHRTRVGRWSWGVGFLSGPFSH
jgi:hypothetical protein